MWNPRLYALILCVGLLARSSHRGALQNLDGELGGSAAFVTFWIPLAVVVYILGLSRTGFDGDRFSWFPI